MVSAEREQWNKLLPKLLTFIEAKRYASGVADPDDELYDLLTSMNVLCDGSFYTTYMKQIIEYGCSRKDAGSYIDRMIRFAGRQVFLSQIGNSNETLESLSSYVNRDSGVGTEFVRRNIAVVSLRKFLPECLSIVNTTSGEIVAVTLAGDWRRSDNGSVDREELTFPFSKRVDENFNNKGFIQREPLNLMFGTKEILKMMIEELELSGQVAIPAPVIEGDRSTEIKEIHATDNRYPIGLFG